MSSLHSAFFDSAYCVKFLFSTNSLSYSLLHPSLTYNLLHPSLKVPSRSAHFQFPHQDPYEKRCPTPEPFLHILQVPQQESPPSRFPSHSSYRQKPSTSRAPFSHLSKSPVYEPTPGFPVMPLWKEVPISRAFFYTTRFP